MKIYLETYGCQMNFSDSELIGGILTGEGFRVVPAMDGADAILINTCAVRENAAERIFNRLQQIGPLKKKKPGLRIGVLGCLAQNLKKDLLDHSGMVDFIVGPDSYRSLPALLKEENRGGGSGSRQATTLSKTETYTDIPPLRQSGVNAWVTVMRGCDNFCTFCVVPYTRGRERSRAVEAVISEVRALARGSFRQVTLLGQNVNSYRHDERGFAGLMREVCRVDQVERVRFMSPHPKDFPDDLLDVIADEPAAMPHIHLPLQSGSDAVLERMNRGYTADDYLRTVDRIRAALPGASITTDLIAGFPGESDADFDSTLRLMERVRFHAAFTFAYSERKGTIAARRFADDVPEPVKIERVTLLIERERVSSRARLEEQVGREVEVLVEGSSRKSPREAFGRTPQGSGVVFPADPVVPGEIRRVTVDRATTHTLIARLSG